MRFRSGSPDSADRTLSRQVRPASATGSGGVAAGAWRGFRAGPEGMELLAFGARCGMSGDERDVHMEQDWWMD